MRFRSTARAQLFRSTAKVGTTAAQFLKIGVGARALGMGGAQVGVTGDICSIYWNPAALSRIITMRADLQPCELAGRHQLRLRRGDPSDR